MTNGTSDNQTKRSEKPATFRRVVRFVGLSIRMIFVIMHDSRSLKKWKRPPESNGKRYLVVVNKSKKTIKKVRFFVFRG